MAEGLLFIEDVLGFRCTVSGAQCGASRIPVSAQSGASSILIYGEPPAC